MFIKEDVYHLLPDALKQVTKEFDQADRQQRDLFLVSCIPAISSIMVNVETPRKGEVVEPLFNLIVVGEPGTGKSGMKRAKQVIVNTQQFIEDQSDSDVDHPYGSGSILVPTNISTRAIYERLEDNRGYGYLFDTELDTIVNSIQSNGQQLSVVIRKFFHHESLTYEVMNRYIHIPTPRPSISVSGTPNQCQRLIPSSKNGLFSRVCFYVMFSSNKWKDLRPTDKDKALNEAIEKTGQELRKLFEVLVQRSSTLSVELTNAQWEQLNNFFRSIVDRIGENTTMMEVAKRMAVNAQRIAMVMCLLRSMQDGDWREKIADSQKIEVNDEDLEIGLELARVFLKGATQMIPDEPDEGMKGQRFLKFYDSLPTSFQTREAIAIGDRQDISNRRIHDYLKELCKQGFLVKKKNGHYRKPYGFDDIETDL